MARKLALLFTLCLLAFNPSRVRAYEDFNWQQSGYAFRGIGDYPKRLGSLSDFRLQYSDTNLPVFPYRTFFYNREDYGFVYLGASNRDIPLMGSVVAIDMPTSFAAKPPETGSWVYKEVTYTYNTDKTFKILFSRLTPAILFTTNSAGIKIFDGNKTGLLAPTTDWQSGQTTTFTTPPKYFAIPTAGGIQIRQADGSGNVSLVGMTDHWIFFWWGENGFLWGTNKVTFPIRGPSELGNIFNPSLWLDNVDLPTLLVLENLPQTLHLNSSGGVEITNATSLGQVALLPLFGSLQKKTSETAGWASGLPTDVQSKISWWSPRLGKFPENVTETYAVNPQTYDLSVTDTFTYRDLGFGFQTAPIPPALALTLNTALPIQMSGSAVDSGLGLSIGPVKVIDYTNTYTYTTTGLGKYAAAQRLMLNTGQAPAALQSKLDTQVDKILAAGHLAPWRPATNILSIFEDSAVWSLPYEPLQYLGETTSVVSPDQVTPIINYMKNDRQSYPPESYKRTVEWLNTVQTMPFNQGTRRESYYVDPAVGPGEVYFPLNNLNTRSLMTLYSLADYYRQTGDLTDLNSRWSSIREILRPYMTNSDWSTITATPYFLWQPRYQGFAYGGINETDRLAAGAVGLFRLGKLRNDTETINVGIFLLNKAILSRFAQDNLVKYLYDSSQQTVPVNPDWLYQGTAAYGETGRAQLWQDNWPDYTGDVRTTLRYDQFGGFIYYMIGSAEIGELPNYAEMTPELGRFIHDYTLPQAQRWLNEVEENNITWYQAYTEGYTINEGEYAIPQNAYHIFNTKAWITQDPPDQLEAVIDLPWVSLGDFFYLHKLAETLKAYRGWCWSSDGVNCDSGVPVPTPTPNADFDGDGVVDMDDYNSLLSSFGTYNCSYNLTGDCMINIFDFSLLVGVFGT